MKTKISQLILFAFFALLSFTACQNETTEVNTPDQQETIQSSSTLATLMSRTTANFGAVDDILDESSCFSVELPVTIMVSGITIIIENEDDLEELEDLFEEFEDEDDFLDFLFPITIIFSDYTEIVIENEEQLENFITDCDDEDDVIECVDFVYPISFSVFNSDFNIVDTITIENDEALYNFLDDLEEDENALIVSLNYPVTLEYANGETIEVNSNQELADAIEAAGDDCDDDDEEDCDDESIELALKECQWEIAAYSSFPEFQGFVLEFNSDYTFDIILDENQTSSEGNSWSVVSNDEGSFLVLTTDFEDLGGDWKIIECDDDRFEFVKNDETMVLEQECEDDIDCSFNDISNILQECPWDFADAANSYSNYQMIFNQGGDLQITEGNATSAIGGAWSLTSTDNGIILTFSELTAFQDDLGGEWLIIQCDDDRLKIIKGDQYLILEQDCEGNNGNEVFDCFGNFELVECVGDNGEAEFNLSADTIGLIDCQYDFIPSFHVSIADAEAGVEAIAETESYWSATGEVYLRIEAANGNFEVFTIYLNTEECDYFECFGDYDLAVCDQDDDVADGFGVFDLNLIFSNCPNDDIAYAFYLTLADAENEVNPLPSPFTNIANPQTIYSRVSLAGDPSIYEIFSHNLIVEDCSNNSGCGEEDVDAFLVECIWNAVNYNGSDNLMNWNFDFEPNSQIVVIYTDTQTIDATWTTSQSNDGVIVTFSNVAGPNIQAITGEWLVVECEEDRLELHQGDNILVLERSCD